MGRCGLLGYVPPSLILGPWTDALLASATLALDMVDMEDIVNLFGLVGLVDLAELSSDLVDGGFLHPSQA